MHLLGSILSIMLINIVLSGDNAVVIGMAAHRLASAQRRWAIIIGSAGAIVIRVVLTAVAAMLLAVPFLKLVGGAMLLWIAFQLLDQGEGEHDGTAAPGTLKAAVWTIVVADVIMSIDNVLGVAAAAHGDTMLLIFGLVMSMPIIVLGGSLIASVLDRFWWLAYLGSAVITWTGLDLMLAEPIASTSLASLGLVTADGGADGVAAYAPTPIGYAVMVALTLLTLAAAHYLHRSRSTRALGAESRRHDDRALPDASR